MMDKDIILFGMQGSGKGTQADLFLEKFDNLEYFEPGNIFRAISSNDNVIGEHIRDRMQRGEMVDDAITFGVFDIYFHLLKKDNCMLIDGFLRTLPQMHYFLSLEYQHKRDFMAIYYDIPKDLALERLMKRATLEGRVDDNETSILKRISIYEQETLPVVQYFESIGKLVRVSGEGSIEDIYEATRKALGV